MASPFTRFVPDGLAISVRVTPKSSRDAVEGVMSRGAESVLKVRVRAAPEDGKANAAVAEVVALYLDCPKRAASVTAGHASRDKTVTIRGDGAALLARLEDRLASAAPEKST